MLNPQKPFVFRNFSANQWNQSETNLHLYHLQKTQNIFSNAEKLRKIDCIHTKNGSLEKSRTIRNNGLRILFSIILGCFSLSSSVR